MKVIDQTTAQLEAKHIKPSLQRLLILNFLNDCRTHPTAEQISTDLAARGHALSKATIYNTLTLFVQKGILRIVIVDQGESRYDLLTRDHAHFVCERCGTIFDVPIDFDPLNPLFENAGVIRQRDLFYRGICRSCLREE